MSFSFSMSGLALAMSLAALANASNVSADGTPPAPVLPPQAGAGCLDLSAYLGQIRGLSDSLFMHHQLVDLSLRGTADGATVSDLANQHALDLFYHPNLVTLGLAAAKNGSHYLHDFTAYQYDCAKVVTGDIFAAEGMSVIWEVAAHTANTLTLKRLTHGGQAEVSSDLNLVMRRFQTLAPTAFAVTSVYGFKTSHPCGAGHAPVDEANIATVTELFLIDSQATDPADRANPALTVLMAQYPRTADPSGHRGDFIHPVSVLSDAACTPAAPVAPGAPTTPAPTAL